MFRKYVGFLALSLVFLLAACSQSPREPNAPSLEPQFGTAADDRAVDVAVQRRLGHVYVAGNFGDRAFLRQYRRDGSLGWERRLQSSSRALATEVDGDGNSYLAWAEFGERCNEWGCRTLRVGAFVSKYSPSGTQLWRKSFPDLLSLAVDASGNLYLGGQNSVRKHTPTGALVWERRPSNREAGITNIAVSAQGNVVAASDNGMIVKYNASGTQLFRTVRNFGFAGVVDLALGPNEEIAATYTVQGTFEGTIDLAGVVVFRPNGVRYWRDRLAKYSGPDNFISPAVTFDASGNVYLTTDHWACSSGLEFDVYSWELSCSEGGDSDGSKSAILVRKYRPDGAPIWSRVFNKHRLGVDAGTGIAAFSAGELYVVGETDSAVNGKQFGGRDAFLIRLNEQGRLVWSR
jgi:hypothetical protein